MSMFSNLEDSFETINASGRSSSNDLVSISHVKGSKKEEVIFRINREAMNKAELNYKDKVQIQFADNNSVCRILKTDKGGSVTLSQQISNNDLSAGIIRLIYKPSIPNFIEMENKNGLQTEPLTRVKYIHENEMIEYGNSQITFKLKVDTYE
jgi:hypothetical protein